MTTTLANARTAVLLKLNAIEPRFPAARVTSAAGNAGGTTAQINKLGMFHDDSFVETHYLVLPDGPTGSGSLEAQVISDFDQDDGSGNTVVSVSEAFTAQVQNAVTAYVSPVHPEELRTALNQAALNLWPALKVERLYHHVNGSRAFNGLWDQWTSGLPDWWLKSNSALTVARHFVPYFGAWGLTLTADGSARYLYLRPPFPTVLNELDTHDVTLYAFISATAASAGGVSITDGAGNGATVFHSGAGGWAKVATAARTITKGSATQPVEFRIHVGASQTVQIGPCWTEGGPETELLPLPGIFRRGPASIMRSSNTWPDFDRTPSPLVGWRMEETYPVPEGASTLSQVRWVRFTDLPATGAALMELRGEDYLSQASIETDPYEVDAPLDQLLYAQAIVELKSIFSQDPSAGGASFQRQLESDWRARLDELLSRQVMQTPRPVHTLTPALSEPGESTGGNVLAYER